MITLFQGRPQLSILGVSVAIAGFIGGLLWFPKEFAADHFLADAYKHGFLSVLFKINFFWKVIFSEGKATNHSIAQFFSNSPF